MYMYCFDKNKVKKYNEYLGQVRQNSLQSK